MFEETKIWKKWHRERCLGCGSQEVSTCNFPSGKKSAWKCIYLSSQWDWVNSARRQLNPNSPDLRHMTSTTKRLLKSRSLLLANSSIQKCKTSAEIMGKASYSQFWQNIYSCNKLRVKCCLLEEVENVE